MRWRILLFVVGLLRETVTATFSARRRNKVVEDFGTPTDNAFAKAILRTTIIPDEKGQEPYLIATE
jgi:hypothetical protein